MERLSLDPAGSAKGKKASKMVTREEETAHCVKDEPADGPACYFYLQGFEDAGLLKGFAFLLLPLSKLGETPMYVNAWLVVRGLHMNGHY